MAQSAVDVCNSALQKVGAVAILSLADNSREARACNIAYDSNRRSELRKHRWNFAIKRAVLAPDVTAPAFDYDYQFTLPTDCLRVLRPNDANLDWVIEGRKLLTNDGTTVNLRYIADIEDTTQWDATFYDMLALALAMDLCEVLTNSAAKKQALAQEYESTARIARRDNAFEQGPQDPPDDTWWLARN